MRESFKERVSTPGKQAVPEKVSGKNFSDLLKESGRLAIGVLGEPFFFFPFRVRRTFLTRFVEQGAVRETIRHARLLPARLREMLPTSHRVQKRKDSPRT